ncbi:hypothetical protein EGA36_12895 [Salmonella enterica]|uniref:Uncharacterized protein n=1 Tax=Salmonella enterica subsp. enterica serovar Bareilly TaxID=58096 RepID=A0A3U6NRB4_SALET|nr:hypothetical protein [Salmonella enterica]AVS51717.1 hypothetical protein C6651_07645 [Salmonella enterica subsp. enterica serovar Concord]EAA0981516.1 hypothetical protein [Salmonella enterica subsp. enterica serovar Bareilly]EAA1643015.1 hypothetical protein [Salmonella enterica subsp. enterica serovar Richmond]EAA3273965.1 hypothetical protein [Salmonella enterica subsp. enterica serovar Brunei]EAA8256949.1 hypothetical protein [Salmonella enterica subsp. enterica]EAC1165698.1 hypotheti
MLRYREFQPVHGTDCLREQGILRGAMPSSVSIFFSSFLLTAAPKRRVRFGNKRKNPENRGIARCGGCASLCRFTRRKVTHWLSAGRERLQILVQVYGHAAAKPDVFAGRSP